MSAYLLLRTVHICCAVLTLVNFSLRGYWMWTGNRLLQHKLTRIVPHIIDTLLLVTAIVLVVMSGFYPGVTSWINYKLVLLFLYIGLGTVALNRGSTVVQRRTAFVLALLTVSSIFAVAFTKP